MLSAKDILPAAAPLGSVPVGSVIMIMLHVAATLLIVIKNIIMKTIDIWNLFKFIQPPVSSKSSSTEEKSSITVTVTTPVFLST